MDATAEIAQAAQAILDAGRLVEFDPADATTGEALDADDASALIEGDVGAGAVIRARRSVLVRGSLCGTESDHVRLEAGAEVVVTGDISFARLQGRSVVVGGRVTNGHLSARRQVGLLGDIDSSVVVAGDVQAPKRKLEELRNGINEAEQEREIVENKLRQDEKKMDRLLASTRVELSIHVGKIVRHRHNRVRINLKPFYEMLGQQPAAAVDRALLEFFAKGIVGHILRAHPEYSAHATRRKVLMHVVRQLKELFVATRRFDHVQAQLSRLIDQRLGLLERLHTVDHRVRLGGGVSPNLDVRFAVVVCSDAKEEEEEEEGEAAPEESQLEECQASWALRHVEESGQHLVTTVDFTGEEATVPAASQDLRGLLLEVAEGTIRQTGIEAAEEAAAASEVADTVAA
jgi:hypothetical protein